MSSLLYAMGRATGTEGGSGGFFPSIFPLIVIFGIFYVLIIRPQQKKAKQHQDMVNNLKKGDRILTSGGIYATVVAVKGNALEVKISDEVKVLVSKSAISAVLGQEVNPAPPDVS